MLMMMTVVVVAPSTLMSIISHVLMNASTPYDIHECDQPTTDRPKQAENVAFWQEAESLTFRWYYRLFNSQNGTVKQEMHKSSTDNYKQENI